MATENKRRFSEEQLQAGKYVTSMQTSGASKQERLGVDASRNITFGAEVTTKSFAGVCEE